jgi:molybdenum cofactor biosynthesis enzyme
VEGRSNDKAVGWRKIMKDVVEKLETLRTAIAKAKIKASAVAIEKVKGG